MDAFEELDVWKHSARLSVNIYRALAPCRDRGFRNQVLRAAISVPSNIAEGYERGSRKEFARFLRIAKGSCAELRTQLYIGMEAGIIEKVSAAQYVAESIALSKMLQGLISSLRVR